MKRQETGVCVCSTHRRVGVTAGYRVTVEFFSLATQVLTGVTPVVTLLTCNPLCWEVHTLLQKVPKVALRQKQKAAQAKARRKKWLLRQQNRLRVWPVEVNESRISKLVGLGLLREFESDAQAGGRAIAAALDAIDLGSWAGKPRL
jgi:hypothetical protein